MRDEEKSHISTPTHPSLTRHLAKCARHSDNLEYIKGHQIDIKKREKASLYDAVPDGYYIFIVFSEPQSECLPVPMRLTRINYPCSSPVSSQLLELEAIITSRPAMILRRSIAAEDP